ERGGIVRLPVGTYAVRGHLEIPRYVTLEGVWTSPVAWEEGKGTVLLAYEGKGREAGPAFITLNDSATLKGVTVFYPEQTGDPVEAYPWCISGAGGRGRGDVAVLDCLLVNPFQGIDLGSRPCARHYVRGVYGFPLRRGLFVDQCFDVGRIENVHFWPFWWGCEHRREVRDFVMAHGEAFVFAMTDWQYVLNTFCWGYHVGYRFTENGRGVCNGNFVGIAADGCNVCVLVDNCAAYGVLITNGQFVAIYGDKPTQVVVKPTHSGTVQFNNCAFWGPCHQCARLEGKGFVSFHQCHFLEWNPSRVQAPCIQADAGTVSVNGCRFAKAAESIALGAEVRGGAITGNLFGRVGAVRVSEGAHAVVEANAYEAPAEDPEAGSTLIGVLGPGVVIEGDWWDFAGRGTYSGLAYFSVPRGVPAAFTWNLATIQPGAYALSAWIPKWVPPVREAGRAIYTIHHTKGEETVEVVQSEHAEQWTPLGQFLLDKNSHVVLTNVESGTVIADCLLLTKAPHGGCQPTG
ncbi:MAG TPA: hypothetical protein HPP77_05930, partial [Candidatus Hydrogenedentes bacterium]|nr:hypothetical protein [Candidatus Hydrogenedentota bacterium]